MSILRSITYHFTWGNQQKSVWSCDCYPPITQSQRIKKGLVLGIAYLISTAMSPQNGHFRGKFAPLSTNTDIWHHTPRSGLDSLRKMTLRNGKLRRDCLQLPRPPAIRRGHVPNELLGPLNVCTSTSIYSTAKKCTERPLWAGAPDGTWGRVPGERGFTEPSRWSAHLLHGVNHSRDTIRILLSMAMRDWIQSAASLLTPASSAHFFGPWSLVRPLLNASPGIYTTLF